jgi:energy-converting hydrogenase Eha subunit E
MIKKLNENKSQILQSSKRLTETALNTVDGVMTKATTEVNTYISPIRTSVLKRFPILFSLLTTLGVATTFLGFEKIVSTIPFLDQNPIVMLILGINILAATGTLYKKLS